MHGKTRCTWTQTDQMNMDGSIDGSTTMNEMRKHSTSGRCSYRMVDHLREKVVLAPRRAHEFRNVFAGLQCPHYGACDHPTARTSAVQIPHTCTRRWLRASLSKLMVKAVALLSASWNLPLQPPRRHRRRSGDPVPRCAMNSGSVGGAGNAALATWPGTHLHFQNHLP